MTKYKLLVSLKVEKELSKLDRLEQKRIVKLIEQLVENPRPAGSKKLVGSPFWRIRSGNYRIVYSIQDNILTIEILRIAHRKELYR